METICNTLYFSSNQPPSNSQTTKRQDKKQHTFFDYSDFVMGFLGVTRDSELSKMYCQWAWYEGKKQENQSHWSDITDAVDVTDRIPVCSRALVFTHLRSCSFPYRNRYILLSVTTTLCIRFCGQPPLLCVSHFRSLFSWFLYAVLLPFFPLYSSMILVFLIIYCLFFIIVSYSPNSLLSLFHYLPGASITSSEVRVEMQDGNSYDRADTVSRFSLSSSLFFLFSFFVALCAFEDARSELQNNRSEISRNIGLELKQDWQYWKS